MLEEEKELLEEEKELLEERVRELTVQLEQAQSSNGGMVRREGGREGGRREGGGTGGSG